MKTRTDHANWKQLPGCQTVQVKGSVQMDTTRDFNALTPVARRGTAGTIRLDSGSQGEGLISLQQGQ